MYRNRLNPLRPQEKKPALQHEQLPVQAVTPQVAYRRAQINRSGLAAADLLSLQHTLGNRQVQRYPLQRAPEEEKPKEQAVAPSLASVPAT